MADVLLLLRHASAGQRGRGPADLQRPLDMRGTAQAAALVDLLGPLLGDGADLRTSSARRCRETVAPLARHLGVDATVDAGLVEGSDVRVLLARMGAGIVRPTLWSSHGDIIPDLLAMLAGRGLDLGPDPRCAKASTWVLTVEEGEARAAHYLPPPT
jgi:phosphohistidine phosphatase SixA